MNGTSENPEKNNEEIAQMKLEELKSKKFSHIAVRFMNEGEYRHVLHHGLQEGNETFLMEKAWFDECFLGEPTDTGFFIDFSGDRTNWRQILDRDMMNAQQLVRHYGQVIRETSKETRDQIWRKMSEKIKGDTNVEKDDRLMEFISNPSSMTRSEFRKLFDAATRHVANTKSETISQYQIMIALSPDAIDLKSSSYNMEGWKLIRKEAPPSSLLAAYSMLPQKEAYGDLVELSSHAGDFAHPVFDHRSILRWPNRKENR